MDLRDSDIASSLSASSAITNNVAAICLMTDDRDKEQSWDVMLSTSCNNGA